MSFFPKINQRDLPGWTTARIKYGRDMPICMTILITHTIKTTRNKVFTIVSAFVLNQSLSCSLYGDGGFVNPPQLVWDRSEKLNITPQIRYTNFICQTFLSELPAGGYWTYTITIFMSHLISLPSFWSRNRIYVYPIHCESCGISNLS